MGVSTDAMLYFGFQVGGEDEPPEWMAGYEEFTDYLAANAGLPIDYEYSKRRELEESCPAELHTFCSYDYPMFILGIRGAEYRVKRGYTQEITPEMLAVDQAKIDAFKAWCESNNIEYSQPKWLLCSLWG